MPGSGDSTNLNVLIVGVTLLLPTLPGFWKAANLRTHAARDWSDRIEIIEAGLTERTKDELALLQAEIFRVLGGPEGDFDPLRVTVDPFPIVRRAERASALLTSCQRVSPQFKRLRQIGPLLLIELLIYTMGVGLATVHFTDQLPQRIVGTAGIAIASIGAAAAILTFVFYAYLINRLTRAEEQSKGTD